MSRLSYMNFPFPFYRNLSRTSSNLYNFSNTTSNNILPNMPLATRNEFPKTSNNFSGSLEEKSQKINRRQNFEFCNDDYNSPCKSNSHNNDYLFDLLGLKIYNDDILLVSLIYFLYSEGVKDDGLFLVLILLLLS